MDFLKCTPLRLPPNLLQGPLIIGDGPWQEWRPGLTSQAFRKLGGRRNRSLSVIQSDILPKSVGLKSPASDELSDMLIDSLNRWVRDILPKSVLSQGAPIKFDRCQFHAL